MNRSYSLNSVCPKFISNKRIFCKIEARIFEVLLYLLQAQADSGPNAGYVFPGSGSAAYASSPNAQPCSYGGLLYAHDLTTIRFWRPAANTNGSVICISEFMGMGTNQQAEENANAIVRVWSFSTQGIV